MDVFSFREIHNYLGFSTAENNRVSQTVFELTMVQIKGHMCGRAREWQVTIGELASRAAAEAVCNETSKQPGTSAHFSQCPEMTSTQHESSSFVI